MASYASLIDIDRLSLYHDKAKLLFATNDSVGSLSNRVTSLENVGAQANVLESVKANGTALSVSSKAVNVTLAEGTSNGSVKFCGTDIQVHGLGSAAYANTSAFDASGAASGVLGSSSDAAGTATVYGALASAALAQVAAERFTGDASDIISGTFNSDRIPNLPASKITSGTIASDRLSDATTQAAGNNSTKIATTAFVATAISNAISGITGISFEVVQALPATGTVGVIYLVPHSNGTNDIYDEYIYVNSAWERIGTTDVDLSGYVLSSDITLATDAQVNALFAA